MSAGKRKPALATPVLKNERAEVQESTPTAPVTLLVTAAEHDERERVLEDIRRLDVGIESGRARFAELRAERGNLLRFDIARRVMTSPRAGGPRGTP